MTLLLEEKEKRVYILFAEWGKRKKEVGACSQRLNVSIENLLRVTRTVHITKGNYRSFFDLSGGGGGKEVKKGHFRHGEKRTPTGEKKLLKQKLQAFKLRR